jgi:hypothetical protein
LLNKKRSKMVEAELSNTLEKTHLSSSPSSASRPHGTPRSEFLPATISRSYSILGVPTDAWVQIFSDRLVVGVTQINQKVGNWCLCLAEQSPVNPKSIDYTINTVLGDRNDAMIGVYTRRITERIIESQMIPGSNYMAVFLGMSLKDKGTDKEMFRLVVEVLVSLVQEALKRC